MDEQQAHSDNPSWLPMPPDTPFSLFNIPFGIFSSLKVNGNSQRRIGTAIGDHVFDISSFFAHRSAPTDSENVNFWSGKSQHSFEDYDIPNVLAQSQTLNEFAGRGRRVVGSVRRYIQILFEKNGSIATLREASDAAKKRLLLKLEDVDMHLPFSIGDYTDFYAGLHHAVNCGRLLRGIGNELQPNYKHLPVGYHGRASSVVISGTPIHRPSGQILTPSSDGSPPKPTFSECRRLDFELELGCFVGSPNTMGVPIPLKDAPRHLFGVVLLNDWSARDIQSWEMVPLGPFNAKNFGTSISPWVVTFDALEAFYCQPLEPNRPLLPYLSPTKAEKGEDSVFEAALQVAIRPSESTESEAVTSTNAKNLLFSFSQMLAHHSINGCPFKAGDLLGSGTISGSERGTFGSLLEQTEGGKQPVKVAGQERTFLRDGDEVVFTGVCGKDQYKMVGFGECRGVILPTACPSDLLKQ